MGHLEFKLIGSGPCPQGSIATLSAPPRNDSNHIGYAYTEPIGFRATEGLITEYEARSDGTDDMSLSSAASVPLSQQSGDVTVISNDEPTEHTPNTTSTYSQTQKVCIIQIRGRRNTTASQSFRTNLT